MHKIYYSNCVSRLFKRVRVLCTYTLGETCPAYVWTCICVDIISLILVVYLSFSQAAGIWYPRVPMYVYNLDGTFKRLYVVSGSVTLHPKSRFWTLNTHFDRNSRHQSLHAKVVKTAKQYILHQIPTWKASVLREMLWIVQPTRHKVPRTLEKSSGRDFTIDRGIDETSARRCSFLLCETRFTYASVTKA